MVKVYDPIMCMMVDKPGKAQDAMNKAIETADAEGEKWITMRGSHVKIDGEGNAVAGNAKVKNIINNGKAGSSKESSGSAREKLNKMSRSDLNHFAEMYGDYDDAESFRKEDIIEDMIEEHGEEKVGKMLNTFNEMFSKGKEKKKENPVVAKKKNESANSNASAREKLSGMSRSDLEHFAEMYGGYEDARGIRKDDIIDDMIDDYGEEKVNKMLETYNGIFKKKGNDSAKAKDESEKYAVTMKNSSGKEQHTQGWDLGSIRNWIKDNEKRGYRVTWKNFDSKTIDKAKDYNALDEAIKTCDASYEYEGTYRGAKIQITVPDGDGTRNVYLDGRALWQDEGSVNKVLSAVKQLIDRQKK